MSKRSGKYAGILLLLGFFTNPAAANEPPAAGGSVEDAAGRVLAVRCVGCHNASESQGGLDLSRAETLTKGGDSGAVVSPSHPDQSLLWERVAAGEMPPKTRLEDAEKQTLKRWIAAGAKWPGGTLDPFQFTSSQRAGYDWWSLQPLSSTRIPSDPHFGEVRNAIDAFVLAHLKSTSGGALTPSPAADRRTLIRRLSFDLLGLPPSLDEIEAFEQDPRNDAYDRLVDRLLASPAYGERWARPWLDLARFGESQGFERDKLRTNSWRYRDWVIDAWNEDLPYDEFCRRQIAGDVLEPQDPAAAIATGFLVAGPWDEVGQKQQSAAMRAVVREDELEDLVATIGQTFLGLTLNCGRCHDHKVDPVTQTEYYRLAASLAGVWHGEPEIAAQDARQIEAGTAGAAARQRVLERELQTLEQPTRERLQREREQRRVQASPPVPYAAWEFETDLNATSGRLALELKQGARQEQGKLHFDGNGFASTTPLDKDIREKTLEAWVRLDNLKQQGGGVISIQTLDGAVFDAIVFGEQEARRWMAGSNGFVRTRSFQGEEERDAERAFVHVAIVYRADGTIIGYRQGRRYGEEYRVEAPILFEAGKTQVVLGLRHGPPGGNRLLTGVVERAALYDRALSDEEVAAAAGTTADFVSEAELVAALQPAQRERREELRFELEQVRQDIARWRDRRAYAVAPQKPNPTHVLLRGNPATPAALVAPGGIGAIRGVAGDFQLPPDASDADRRRKLADWIANDHNPLFARVIVNRLWQFHFGVGLVDTPNDFGFNGGRPSHPALLDWLARELVRSDWSLKRIQRLMVTSATYRQTSRSRIEGIQMDAANRLLWRKSPQRLEAEMLRDTLLSVTGELNSELHGPGYYDFRTFTSNSQFYELRDPVGPTFQRRSLYRTWVRSGRNPFLDVFDCPDPSTKTPTRPVTTTPLQALALLNNSAVLRLSERLAQQLKQECGDDPAAQVGQAFRIVLGREPDAEELSWCEPLARSQGADAVCRLLFNSNELLYVD